MYDMLLRLPLFQGMSKEDLFEVFEHTVFRFRKVEDGKLAFRQGERCDELTFLMHGCLVMRTQASGADLAFAEELFAYTALEPQSMFGRSPYYKSSYVARGGVSLLGIDKREVYELVTRYEIFRINLLNMLSSRVENLTERLWQVSPYGLEGRLVLFLRSLCSSFQGTKTLQVKMEDLADLLDDTRLNVSRILNKWKDEGLISMRRKEFVVHDMAALWAYFTSQA